jgi:hypothetical protein
MMPVKFWFYSFIFPVSMRRVCQEILLSRSNMTVDPADNIPGAHGAGHAGYFTTGFEYDHSGNAANVKLPCNSLFLFSIEFGKAHPRFKRNSRLGIGRSHHLAWPAPGRPEIDNNRNIVSCDLLLKTSAGQFQRMPGKQRRFTLTATGMLGQALGCYTIYRITVGTDNMQRTHGMT